MKVKVLSKNRVTLPIKLVKALGIKQGQKLKRKERDQKIVIEVPGEKNILLAVEKGKYDL